MPGWSRNEDERSNAVRTDGGTDDDVAEIKQMLEDGDDQGGLADAVTETGDDEESESSAAMDFGMKVGAPLAILAVGLLFVGPAPHLRFTPGDVVLIESLDVGGPGNVWYISGATLVLSLLVGLVYPSLADELDEDYKMDLGLGVAFPTLGLMGALVLAVLLWPVVHSLLAGALVEAGFFIVVAVVIIGIAVAGSIITLAIAALATLYIVGPALVGSYVGGFLGKLVAT